MVAILEKRLLTVEKGRNRHALIFLVTFSRSYLSKRQ